MRLFYAPRGGLNGSVAVRHLLLTALRAEHNFTFTKLPEIKKTPNGKPYFPGYPGIHFSLSHSKTHVLCAVGNTPIGVDIESPREISDRTASFFCSCEERADFDLLDLWLLKESYIKLTDSRLAAARKIRFSRAGNKITAPDERVVSRLYREGICRAALCTIGCEPPETLELVENLTGAAT